MTPEPPRYGADWSREEIVLALYLYCQTPFARTKANNPDVARLANVLGRTPSAVARKLGNLGALDPSLQVVGIKGLTHGAKADAEVWVEYAGRWDALVRDARRLLAGLGVELPACVVPDSPVVPDGSAPTERIGAAKIRLGQAFFRRTVLASYGGACCICGLDLAALLIASHIVPWWRSRKSRLDPQNGLCLCAIHDKAFDAGLIAVSPHSQVLVSEEAFLHQGPAATAMLTAHAGSPVRRPDRFAPRPEYLDWHRHHVFRGPFGTPA